MDSVGLVILAGGEGKRLKLNVPKPLAPLRGKCLIDYSLELCFNFLKDKKGDVSVVTGHRREEVENHITKRYPKVHFALQKNQLGTADALKSYFNDVSEAKKHQYTAVICADTPLLKATDVDVLFEKLTKQNLSAVAATFSIDVPKGYGRIVRAKKGFSIVEEKDANSEQKLINEVNSGLYIFKTEYVLEHINQVKSTNAASEFYLTDLFKNDREVEAVLFEDGSRFLGVNDIYQLNVASRKLNKDKTKSLMESGVLVLDPSHTYVEDEVEVATGATLFPNIYLHGKTQIGEGAIIEAGCVIKNSQIEAQATVKAYCYIEKSIVGQAASIGPFAHLRAESEIGPEAKIGNFVETKKVKLSKGVKISHLSYIGDAEVGENSNLGCGFITCNYDGANKHKTIIGRDCFIGSDSQMIAPLNIGDECYVASGSTINHDMPSGSFAIARERQQTKEGMARRFIKKKDSSK
ncbi:MAG: UDP-N-acetylglucosamine diphosphorylase/glucosamine-1-phosphate N-acetyltransferase [Bdellovibrio sp. CG12_big_fil_rev_8_21_14_0_65_39_13]|nr:MAG: UDP-N-acetylglucosamine diphosphorylase/glucosamine-1-phosphate N-acetyltransferase [Bdellovibrio sp. CG22_combo_CG10-13_8_21_14_all_39_27]PIQ61675.1 MAG: UDP-N-acetylglucosamine diphosphorylase/glucosamine-1-phosphate N-acetyltransferase [Bdellovibrio sp. CG12_big_fil_rev_8_21_14_0_65_39_13]PIR35619.1 MAG: UDP-N-acetylglucosamine diphosphorylase/glucosamine-1-phosphate N-acetyltransferase [Bdellovibrio sp. CG11_big_fil_rev_8_21_14_0_20_39_38]